MGEEDFSFTLDFTAAGFTYSGSGTMDYYVLYEVARETGTQYTLSVKNAIGMTMDLSMSGSYRGVDVSGTMDIVMSGTANGNLYINKDDLSITGGDLTFDFDIDATGNFGGMMGAFTMTMNLSGEATFTFDPPLDLFDFPISTGDNWSIQSTMTMTGSATGEISAPQFGTEPMTITVPLDMTESIYVNAECPTTVSIQTAAGVATTAYKITFSESTGVPFLTGTTFYYSEDEGFIISEETDFGKLMSSAMGGAGEEASGYAMGLLDMGGVGTLSTSPMTKSEVMSAIDLIAKGEWAPEIGKVGALIILVAVVIAVVMAVVVILVVARKKQSTSEVTIGGLNDW
jgi:hypothetical protein